jgi:uncharacterized protein YabN with tetrapyrrole methylase and pyrophosphatase domain
LKHEELIRCIEVIERLRHPTQGCPWDLEQTHQTLLKYLLEESYEFIEATELNDPKLMEEELGDVLLQILLHSTIASESHHFTLDSVAKTLSEKIIRRHPHVFGEQAAEAQLTSEQLIAAGVLPGVIRLSVGIEDADDIIYDLDQALTLALKG